MQDDPHKLYGPRPSKRIMKFPRQPIGTTPTFSSEQTAEDASISLTTSIPSRLKSLARQTHLITFQGIPIDLSGLEQLVHTSQSRFILETLLYLSNESTNTGSTISNNMCLKELVDLLDNVWNEDGGMEKRVSGGNGFEFTKGGYARVRIFELAGAINRISGLSIM